MEQLGKIFDSEARVKLMRLFLFNEDTPFDTGDVEKRSRVTKQTASKELQKLKRAGFLKKKKFTKTVYGKKRKDGTRPERKKKVEGWILNKKFPLIEPLASLLIDSELVKTNELPKRFKKAGTIKVLALSGLFVKDPTRVVDMLIVGKNLKRKEIDKVMRQLEAEIGKEIHYAVFDEDEFRYRLDMYDKLVRDVFDHTNKQLVNKLETVL